MGLNNLASVLIWAQEIIIYITFNKIIFYDMRNFLLYQNNTRMIKLLRRFLRPPETLQPLCFDLKVNINFVASEHGPMVQGRGLETRILAYRQGLSRAYIKAAAHIKKLVEIKIPNSF